MNYLSTETAVIHILEAAASIVVFCVLIAILVGACIHIAAAITSRDRS